MKNKLFNKAIQWARRKGFKNIKANTDDYETPKTFTKPNKEVQIVPDLSGELRGKKYYVEIAVKEVDRQQQMVSKWKLLSTLASRKGGKLYLLAARGHKAFAQKIVDQYSLKNATVVSI